MDKGDTMSERDLFMENIPQIANLIVEVKKLSKEQYEEWKREYLKEVQIVDLKALTYAAKIVYIIDQYLQKEGAANG